MELQFVPIKGIVFDKSQPRQYTGLDPESIKGLAESMATSGLQEIPTGTKVAGGKILLKNGQRRTMAAKKLGWKTLPVMVVEDQKPEDRYLGQMAANTHRENLSPKEEILAVKKAAEYGLTSQHIGLAIGRSASMIEGTLRLSELPDKYLTLIDEGKLQKEIGIQLLQFPSSEIDEAWSWAEKGTSVKARLAKLEAYKEAKAGGVKETADETLTVAKTAMNRLLKAAKKVKGLKADDCAAAFKSDLGAYEGELKGLVATADALLAGLKLFKSRKKDKPVD